MRREVRGGALWAFVVLVLGVGLGLLWLWLAPRVPLVSVDDSVFLKDPEGEEAIGADGTFVLLAVAFGVVTGLVAFLRSRGGGIGIVVGLAVGALLGSVLAWQLGVWLGPGSDLAASAKAAGENKTFDGPLKLQAKGALVVWPFFALGTHLALMAVFGRRDPEPEPVPSPLPPSDGGAAQHW
ncbi:ABC transporter permease [Streptomyces abyssalis]|uniref:ABC transporter permease n=1 Tax=Streptomyces abyssalis TaxID=933944 RepID=A0A1E7JM45_9ACTN|nr:ABC transporter permease [Streptomyces abyssalis]OEU91340.1 ABC transporter permease [Streptomyces abyssalis]